MASRSILGALIGALGLIAAPSIAQQGGQPSPKVTVAAAYTEEITQQITFIGIGEAIDRVDIVARVDGFLQAVEVEDGHEVSQGDPLFRIEPDAYEATLAARQADLAEAEANLELARIEKERAEELVRRDAAPQSQADVAVANEAVAEAKVQSAKAAIRQAELNLSYTEISAPFDGRVGRTNTSIGDIVGPSKPALVTLVREQPMQVAFSLNEKQLITIQEQLETDTAGLASSEMTPDVYVILPNGTELDEPGQIVFVDNRIDPTTGAITLRAEFPNTRRLIVDGSFVTLRIEAMQPVQELLIPLAAVQRDQRGDFVLVVTQQQTVEQRYVTLGDQQGTAVIVRDGMQEGESVIVEGLQRVRPGATVDAVVAGTPAAPTE